MYRHRKAVESLHIMRRRILTYHHGNEEEDSYIVVMRRRILTYHGNEEEDNYIEQEGCRVFPAFQK